tara:strand:+ start:49602 stop:49892 length:291 start_codon:yes stop_codon:yes gene_type:complete
MMHANVTLITIGIDIIPVMDIIPTTAHLITLSMFIKVIHIPIDTTNTNITELIHIIGTIDIKHPAIMNIGIIEIPAHIIIDKTFIGGNHQYLLLNG